MSIDVQSAIPPGEKILWRGKPKKGFRFTAADPFLTLFGLFFLAVSSVFVVSLFPWGLLLPHFWIGVYMAFGRYFVAAKSLSSTEYVMTANRVIIAKSWPRTQIKSVTLTWDQQTTLTTHSDGTSSVTFGTTVPGYQRNGRSMQKTNGDPTFEFLEKPFEVTQIIETRRRNLAPAFQNNVPPSDGLPLPADGYQPLPADGYQPLPLQPWTPTDRPQ